MQYFFLPRLDAIAHALEVALVFVTLYRVLQSAT